ncbi:MAG: hypothetical protein IPM76_21575 [Chloroflexi bacterium]|nr:hypothetical protein [Chloroflexota bacterium]
MLAIVFIVLSLPHAWSRYVTISMLLALSMWHVTNNKNKWPNIIVLLSLVLVTLIYQARGHTQWSFSGIPQAVDESLKEVTNKGVGALAESDTQMLATFWIESAWHDDWIGHDYGLRFLNYFLTGWIPSRYMPQKYFLVDWLSAKRPPYPITFDRLLYGAKSSLIGSFYANGNIVAVVLQMALMGWFSRKVDGMVQSETPIAIRALGISWLSTLWMVWGSHDYWGLMLLGTMAIPFLIGFPVFHFKGRALSLERSTKTNYKAKVFDVRS